jgi:ferredoxin/flavodoxin
MKTAIYYFSSTGNSLVVAKDLVRGLDNAELIAMNKVIEAPDAARYETVGFVYPVYMFGLPLIVADFLKTVKINPATYVFSVTTSAGLVGRAHSLAKKILKKRGIDLAVGFSVTMPGNYAPLYGAFSKERQDKIFAQQKIKAQEVLDYVLRKKRGRIEENHFLLNLLLYKIFYRVGSSQIPLSAKGFWVTEACTECALCVKICPVGNIQMRDARPFWQAHCQHCMGCLQWCPAQAIQYRRLTLGKKRYHHPDVQALDIIGQG